MHHHVLISHRSSAALTPKKKRFHLEPFFNKFNYVGVLQLWNLTNGICLNVFPPLHNIFDQFFDLNILNIIILLRQ